MTTARKFQVEDIAKIKKFGGRALDASEMGLGKTVKAILYADWHLPSGPVVVVCPKTIKPNWKKEARLHAGYEAEICSTKRCPAGRPPHNPAAFYVVNYDVLGHPDEEEANRGRSWWRWLRAAKPRLVVIDEIQNVKNEVTSRYKCLKELCRGVPHVLGLGGTGGLENNVSELWAPLSVIKPGLFPSKLEFCDRFSHSKIEYGKWVHRGGKNLPELHKILTNKVMVRRRKEDVLKDLPPKSRHVVHVELEGEKEYKQAETQFRRWLAESYNRGDADGQAELQKRKQFNELRMLVGRLKYEACLEWVSAFLLDSRGKKLLVGGVNVQLLTNFHKAFPGSVLVNGQVTGRKRQDAIDRFNGDPECRLFFGNMKAAGEGWNCVSADDVAFVQMGLKPSEHTQFEDRVNGMGRGTKGGRTRVWYLLAAGTVEERQCELIQRKQETLSAVLDGRAVGHEFDVFSLLCDSIRKGVGLGKAKTVRA